jgi:hypothetical protein
MHDLKQLIGSFGGSVKGQPRLLPEFTPRARSLIAIWMGIEREATDCVGVARQGFVGHMSHALMPDVEWLGRAKRVDGRVGRLEPVQVVLSISLKDNLSVGYKEGSL